MIKTLVIDDEQHSRNTLIQLTRLHCPHLDIVSEAYDVKSGLGQIAKHQPELIFLDVEMPDGTGFDLLEQIPNPEFEVIFTTAYDKYALNAFQCSAVGYLLKPVDEIELIEAVAKIEKLLKYAPALRSSHMKILIENYKKPIKLVLPDAKGFQILLTDNIIQCKGEGNYTRIHLLNSKNLLSSKTLAHFETLLSPHGFFRASKAHLLNLSHINCYLNKNGGTAVMTDDSEIPIHPSFRKEFKKLFL